MHQPAFGHEEADELLGGGHIAAILEDYPLATHPGIGNGSPLGPSGHSIVAVYS